MEYICESKLALITESRTKFQKSALKLNRKSAGDNEIIRDLHQVISTSLEAT